MEKEIKETEINVKDDKVEAVQKIETVNFDQKMGYIMWGVFAAGFITGGIGFLAALIFAYVVRGDSDPTLKTHCRYLIRTFWFGLLWSIISTILIAVIIGIPLLIALSVWFLYRTVKGFYNTSKGKRMYTEKV